MIITKIVTSIIGSSNQRTVRKLQKIVNSINALEQNYKSLKDEEFKELTLKFKERVNNGESLDAILPEVFAVAREAAVRSLGLRPFDVQLMGGMVLNSYRFASMLPQCLNRKGCSRCYCKRLPCKA